MAERALGMNRGFVVGGAVCAAVIVVPLYMIIVPRGPAVETIYFRMEPNEGLRPGDQFDAVWRSKTLRLFFMASVEKGCEGTVFRRFEGTNMNGEQQSWIFPPTYTAHLKGPIGHEETYSSQWIVPRMKAGTTGTMHKDIHRWCNWAQWFYKITGEHEEATFKMAD